MDHIADVERDGHALLSAARAAGLDAPVPSCPGWDVRRLLSHTTKVLERTALLTREGLDAPPGRDAYVPFPDDDGAYARFGSAVDEVVAALTDADPAASCWNFTGEDANVGFWQRRMANEVAVHRWDAEGAAGTEGTIDAERGTDGIDEMLTVLLPYVAAQRELALDASVHLHSTDVDGEWLTVFHDGVPTTTREHAKGDLAVRGPAGALFLWASNRIPVGTQGVESFGDPTLLEAWTGLTF